MNSQTTTKRQAATLSAANLTALLAEDAIAISHCLHYIATGKDHDGQKTEQTALDFAIRMERSAYTIQFILEAWIEKQEADLEANVAALDRIVHEDDIANGDA